MTPRVVDENADPCHPQGFLQNPNVLVRRKVVEEMSRSDDVDGFRCEGNSEGVGGDSSGVPAELLSVKKMLKFEVETDRKQTGTVQPFQKIGGTCAEIQDGERFPGVRYEPFHETAIDLNPTQISIDATQVVQRTEHVLFRSIVLVEQLLGFDPPRGQQAHDTFFNTSAEFFDPKAIVLQTAVSISAFRATSAT